MDTKNSRSPEHRERATNPATPPRASRLRQPIVVWLPKLGSDVGRAEVARDVHRASAEWAGEVCIWMNPDFDGVHRWWLEDFRELALPAEHLDAIHVGHIGANGRVIGPYAAPRFRGRRIDGLLQAWLNVAELGGCRSIPAPGSLKCDFPTILKDGVGYREETISVLGGAKFDPRWEANGSGFLQWPPEGRSIPSTSFPDAESFALNPPVSRELDADGRPFVRYRDGTVAHQVVNVWPHPLRPLMPMLGSLGDILGQREMAAVASISADDVDYALVLARRQVAPFLGKVQTTWRDAFVYPTLLNGEPGPVLFQAEKLGVAHNILRKAYGALNQGSRTGQCLEEILLCSPEFERAMSETITVTRVWGAVGLFWFLLLEELEATRSQAVCRHCGQFVQGKRGKQFCGRDDNGDCFRARRAMERRHSRRPVSTRPQRTK